jgi:two-component system, LytTR family, sensor kinase
MKNIYEPQEFPGVPEKWKKQYQTEELDSVSGLPLHLILAPGEKELFFFLNAAVYKKEAIEYKLARDGRIISDWAPNTVDNAFIWLNNLSPGKYSISIRYRKQRHNTLLYEFDIQPFWYQRWAYKIPMAVLGACFIGSFLLLYLLNKQRKKTRFEVTRKEILELKVKSIYAQLNPHFIFNALNSIQALINRNDQEAANRYLSDFGEIVRYALSGTEKMLMPLPQELHLVETYLSMENLRFDFTYSISMAEGTVAADWEIPALLLQPLVENAVKHGIAGMNENGVIGVFINSVEDELVITITDNGKGFQPDVLKEGYGLKITRERIKILNDHFDGRVIKLSMNNNHEHGAAIQLQFKNYRV